MKDSDIILSFIWSCSRGTLGAAECGPVFVLGGIVLAVAVLGITLATLMIKNSRADSQST